MKFKYIRNNKKKFKVGDYVKIRHDIGDFVDSSKFYVGVNDYMAGYAGKRTRILDIDNSSRVPRYWLSIDGESWAWVKDLFEPFKKDLQ